VNGILLFIQSSVHTYDPGFMSHQANGHAFANARTFPYEAKRSSLGLGRKIYEFYTAPITKFWAHAVSLTFCIVRYYLFRLTFCNLTLFNYSVISDMLNSILEKFYTITQLNFIFCCKLCFILVLTATKKI
jgi:hypothetical protein